MHETAVFSPPRLAANASNGSTRGYPRCYILDRNKMRWDDETDVVFAGRLMTFASAHGSGDFGAQYQACVTLTTDAKDGLGTRHAPPLKAEAIG